MSTAAAEGTFPSAPNWVAVVMKTTEEVDSKPFAQAEAPRKVLTTRTWYINTAMPEAMRYLKEVPET